jgi:hypothetical protein
MVEAIDQLATIPGRAHLHPAKITAA